MVFSDVVDKTIKETSIETSKRYQIHYVLPIKEVRGPAEISMRYQIHFLEIGTDDDHIQFFNSVGSNVKAQ